MVVIMDDELAIVDAKEKALTKAWMPAFLAALSQSPNVTGAARLAGITRQHAYQTRDIDPAFKAAWDDAIEQAVDGLEDRAYTLAHAGLQGISPVLLIFLLKGRRREIYGDQVKAQVDSTMSVTGSVSIYIPDNQRGSDDGNDQG